MLFVSTGDEVLTDFFRGGGKTGCGHRREGGMTIHSTHRVEAVPCRQDGPPADVTTWRRCRLLEAGFPVLLATVLAGTASVDVHALLQLVDRGCSPDLAARILSPLDLPGGLS